MLSRSHKKLISEGLKKAHKEGRHPGWGHINENANKSYPERRFSKILDSFGYYEKFNIREHFRFGKYTLDFAIIDLKIDIEIDGQQHFRTQKLIEKDRERDLYLERNGWLVYRIAWLELLHIREKTINDFNHWINDMDRKISRKYNINEVKYLIKMPEPKYGNREDYIRGRREESDKKYKEIIVEAINSDIDFSKFGWVNRVSGITGIKSQKVHKWMKRVVPDFYEKECFKRRPSSSIG
jgi:very-short-patch-repair endonuclease